MNPAHIDNLLSNACANGDVAGVVAMATTARGPIYQGAFGAAEHGKAAPMRADTIFRLASMTKPITSLAALQLVEQGRLDLDAPIAAVLPHLADPRVFDGFAPDATPILRPARRPITLRHLLTHTAGYGYGFWNADYVRICAALGCPPLPSDATELARLPLLFDPGDRWNYGISTDIVGHAIEAVTRTTLASYIGDNITGPLGMTDTSYAPEAARHHRLAGMHRRDPSGGLTTVPATPVRPGGFLSGGGGLFGTAADYIRFLRLLLNRGTLDGIRLLRPDTMAEMWRNQLGTLRAEPMRSADPSMTFDVDLLPGIGAGWGLGFLVNTQPGPNGRSAGSLAWAGMLNTYFWIDFVADIAGVMLTQSLPFADPKALRLLGTFERGVYRNQAVFASTIGSRDQRPD